MLTKKNISPRQLSLLTALLLALPIAIGFWVIENFVAGIIAGIVIFALAFILIDFVLEWFIYRKIKLIYKFIYQTKASKREETYYKYILPRKSIDEVSEDVEKWAEQRSAEIATPKPQNPKTPKPQNPFLE